MTNSTKTIQLPFPVFRAVFLNDRAGLFLKPSRNRDGSYTSACNGHQQSPLLKYKTNYIFTPVCHSSRCLLNRGLSRTPFSLYFVMIYDTYGRIRRSDQFLLKLHCPPQSHPQVEHNGLHGNRRISLYYPWRKRFEHMDHTGVLSIIN